MLKKIINLPLLSMRTTSRSIYSFAKQDKPAGDKPAGKGGKKQQPSSYVAPVQKQPQQQIIKRYLTKFQQTISPEQLQTMNEKFADISEQQKTMLQGLAVQILDLKTPTFLQFIRRGGLGTSDSLFVATGQINEEQISKSIKYLRKQ